MRVPKGVLGLIESRKIVLGLIVYTSSFVALITGHLDGSSFAIVSSTSITALMAAHAYQNRSHSP